MEFLIKNDIALEVCPYSNYLTQAFTTYQNHPLRQLFEKGVPVTINSDDPGMFDSLLSDDYYLASQYQNFSLDDFKKCNETAYKHSFISEQSKARVWKT
jgi:adenosine deaminase